MKSAGPGRLSSLVIEKPVYGGDGLARASGRAVFVPLTLPGETVSAHVTEEKRNFAKAELDEVLAASPHRIAPRCPYFGACGGCHYQHADSAGQLAMKQQILRETLTRAGVPLPRETRVLSGNPWAYRNRIRLAVFSGHDGGPDFRFDGRMGYRARRSHDLIAVDSCPIAAPALVEAAQSIVAFLGKNPGPARVCELELFTNHDESQMLATLFCEGVPGGTAQPWLETLYAELTPRISGVRVQVQDGALDPQILASTGQPALTYLAGGIEYQVGHGAFFQVNRWLLDEFAALATGGISGRLAWDLYAGVGLFARRLEDSFAEVVAVESSPAAWPGLEANLTRKPAGTAAQGRVVPDRSNTLEFLRRNREQRQPRPDFIVLDPPRAGLGGETTTLLNQIHAPEVVYVSCDPATLARDLRALTQERYELVSLTLADMFPQTFHLETVARLRAR